MWTQIIDPDGSKKVLKTSGFFDFGAAGCCFVLLYPLKTIPLWVSVWVGLFLKKLRSTFTSIKQRKSSETIKISELFWLRRQDSKRPPEFFCVVKCAYNLHY